MSGVGGMLSRLFASSCRVSTLRPAGGIAVRSFGARNLSGNAAVPTTAEVSDVEIELDTEVM